ncbi:hypothetical protein MIR68_006497 [Amoeboaphelidium protococcarum]|nr:hypothetical protein MIR68_006497 [Amoeboaphelidium protococcarum]
MPDYGSSRNPGGHQYQSEWNVLWVNGQIPIPYVYQCWLEGQSVEDAQQNLVLKGLHQYSNPKYITSQYILFKQLEHYLHHPIAFKSQQLHRLPDDDLLPLSNSQQTAELSDEQGAYILKHPHLKVMNVMVSMYYDFNDGVMRELFGRKLKGFVSSIQSSSAQGAAGKVMRGRLLLNKSVRKELDEIAIKCSVSVGSIKRLVDNIRRISKKVEELKMPYDRVLSVYYQLPADLVRRYSIITFMYDSRIDSCINKSAKLNVCDYQDLEYIGGLILDNWTLQYDQLEQQQQQQQQKQLQHSQGTSNQNQRIHQQHQQQQQYLGLNSDLASNILDADQYVEDVDPKLVSDIKELKYYYNSKDISEDFRLVVMNSLIASTISDFTSSSNPADGQATLQLSSLVAAQLQQQYQLQSQQQSWNVNSISASGNNYPSVLKQLVKSVVSIGSSLNNSKELKNFLITLFEKILEPCCNAGWSMQDFSITMTSIEDGWISYVQWLKMQQLLQAGGNQKQQLQNVLDHQQQLRMQTQQETIAAPGDIIQPSLFPFHKTASQTSLNSVNNKILEDDVVHKTIESWQRLCRVIRLASMQLYHKVAVVQQQQPHQYQQSQSIPPLHQHLSAMNLQSSQ